MKTLIIALSLALMSIGLSSCYMGYYTPRVGYVGSSYRYMPRHNHYRHYTPYAPRYYHRHYGRW